MDQDIREMFQAPCSIKTRESAFVNYKPHSLSHTQVHISAFFQYLSVLYDGTHTQSHSSGCIGGNLGISIMPNIQNGEDGGSI